MSRANTWHLSIHQNRSRLPNFFQRTRDSKNNIPFQLKENNITRSVLMTLVNGRLKIHRFNKRCGAMLKNGYPCVGSLIWMYVFALLRPVRGNCNQGCVAGDEMSNSDLSDISVLSKISDSDFLITWIIGCQQFRSN